MALSQEQLARFVLKPLVLLGCLAPFAWLAAGIAGIGPVSLGANPVEEILHTLGKWGLNFLLITLCVTPLRQLTGWVHWIRLRRMLGLTAFFYLLGHFLFYLLVDQGVDYRLVLEDVAKRPYITVGFTGLMLLVPLALTSTRTSMRRLGRRWQTLHRLVYVAALLGCIHFYWQVKADVREPLLYFAALAVLLGWRWWKYRQRLARAAAPTATRIPASTSAPPTAVRRPMGSSSSHHASRDASTGSPVSAIDTNAA
jgi:sulfoxide reductase heme-binding subunit YedZ